jgi:hypothetical protein
LLAGTSGGGKSTLATGMLERIIEKGYQFCIIDPEGDYQNFDGTIVLGNAQQVPNPTEVLTILSKPAQNLVVNLMGVKLEDRPFNPHLTLGRIKNLKDLSSLKDLMAEYENSVIQKVFVDEVILYESLLLPSGPVYKPVYKVTLQ